MNINDATAYGLAARLANLNEANKSARKASGSFLTRDEVPVVLALLAGAGYLVDPDGSDVPTDSRDPDYPTPEAATLGERLMNRGKEKAIKEGRWDG